jgi:hypothetical protein
MISVGGVWTQAASETAGEPAAQDRGVLERKKDNG